MPPGNVDLGKVLSSWMSGTLKQTENHVHRSSFGSKINSFIETGMTSHVDGTSDREFGHLKLADDRSVLDDTPSPDQTSMSRRERETKSFPIDCKLDMIENAATLS